MKAVFLGTPQFAVPSLAALTNISAFELLGVVTHPDRPQGRNLQVVPPAVKTAAQQYGLPVYQARRVAEIKQLKGMDLDLLVVVSFGEILTKEILSLPKLGCINLHSSLLPKYRGAAPIAWALINGEKTSGVTTFWISPKMDAGDIILQREEKILPEDTRGSLSERFAKIGAELLTETIQAIAAGTAPRIPQNNAEASFAPKLKKKDGLISWTEPAENIHSQVRGMNPWPAAHTYRQGKRIEIWQTAVVSGDSEPGTVVSLSEEGIGVGTGKGTLLIKELQAEGKKRIKAVDFIHGYRLNEGTKFNQ